MSINPNVQYPGRVTAPDADYPYASSKNETSPGAGDGTPYEKARANDVFGMQQALLKSANITPSGNADNVNDSEYVASMVELASGRAFNYDDSGVANVYVLDIQTNQQGPRSYFDGMEASFIPLNNNTAASTVNINNLGTLNIVNTNEANTIVAGKRVRLRYNGIGNFDIVEAASFKDEIRTVTASLSSGDLILGLNATTLSFRDTNTTGEIFTIETQPLSLVIPAEATLGVITTNVANLILLAIYHSGVIELAVVNQRGGNNLNESVFLQTSQLNVTSDFDNVIYSDTGRDNVSFRIVGIITMKRLISDTWTDVDFIQGIGGNVLNTYNTLGYQTWKDVTSLRDDGITFHNTTGKPLYISVKSNEIDVSVASMQLQIDNEFVFTNSRLGDFEFNRYTVVGIIPPGSSYLIDIEGAISVEKWYELS